MKSTLPKDMSGQIGQKPIKLDAATDFPDFYEPFNVNSLPQTCLTSTSTIKVSI